MQPLQIKSMLAKEKPGDLRARLDAEHLLLPERIAMALAALGIRTASDLVSYLQAFPSAIAGELGWKVDDVTHALKVLRTQLKGRVDDSILNPPPRSEPSFGAIKPPILNERRH